MRFPIWKPITPSDLVQIFLLPIFPEKDVLTRSVRIENRGENTCNLEKVASFCLDLHQDGFEVIHLHGAWAKERHIQRLPQSAAMMGRFGLELDLGKLEEETMDALSKEIALYKTYQQDIHQGDLYRLLSPYKGRTAAYEIVSDQRVLVFIMNITGAPCQAPLRLKLQGLEPRYRHRHCL